MNPKILDSTEFYKFGFHKKIVTQKNLPLQTFANSKLRNSIGRRALVYVWETKFGSREWAKIKALIDGLISTIQCSISSEKEISTIVSASVVYRCLFKIFNWDSLNQAIISDCSTPHGGFWTWKGMRTWFNRAAVKCLLSSIDLPGCIVIKDFTAAWFIGL